MRLTTIARIPMLIFACLIAVGATAQSEAELAAFLKASKQDANVLITGYTGPLVRGASYGATGGWFTTGKTHKTLGFDLGVSMTLAFTPKSDDYFTPAGLDPNTTFANTTNPSKNAAPTFLGPKDDTHYTTIVQTQLGPQSVQFNGPEGLDVRHYVHFAAIPVPMIQLGIGIIKNTDLKLRFIPTINKGNTKVSMFGVGLMHDVKQYIPGKDFLPFDLSVLLGFTNIKGTTSLVNTDASSNAPTSPDGQLKYKLNSWVGQAIISKKLAILTFFLAAGYGSVTTNADITGTFSYSLDGQSISVKDPYATTFKAKSAKLTGGMRLKMGPIYLAGDYTLQKYNALTVGLGVAFR